VLAWAPGVGIDVLARGLGTGVLVGEPGAGVLVGEPGAGVLVGEPGAGVLVGEPGAGVLVGEPGAGVACWAWLAAAPSAPDGPLGLGDGLGLAEVGLVVAGLAVAGLAVDPWLPVAGADEWPVGAAAPVPVAAWVARSAWLAPTCWAAAAGPPGVPGVTILIPAPWASRGIRRIQPGLISAAIVSLVPSGCGRSLFISKISR
jgi:hypothetical protein